MVEVRRHRRVLVFPLLMVTLAIVSGYWGLPMWLGIVLALLVGVGTGLINGILITRTNVPSFVITLGTNFGLVGLTLGLGRLITGSTNVAILPDPASKAVFGTLIAGQFETSIIWFAVVAIVVGWALHKTPWGNWLFAIGGDKESARASGIPVARVTVTRLRSPCSGSQVPWPRRWVE